MITVLASLVLAPQATNPVNFPLIDFNALDGKSVQKIVFGVSTDSSIKRLYRWGKGAQRPEAILLRSDVYGRVEAFLDGRGGGAICRGLYVIPTGQRIMADQLDTTFGAKGEDWYTKARHQDWWMKVWPARGTAAFVYGPNQEVLAYVYGNGDTMKFLTRSLYSAKSEVTRVPDPGEQWDRRLRFRDISVSFNFPKQVPEDITERRMRGFIEDCEDEIKDLRGTIRFDREAVGKMTLLVSCEEFDEEGIGEISVRARYDGSTPYGTFYQFTTESRKISTDHIRRIGNLAEDALTNLDRIVRDKVKNLRPPTADEVRAAQWYRILDAATQKPRG